jgi:general stress protein 26
VSNIKDFSKNLNTAISSPDVTMRIASHMEHSEWDSRYMTYQHDVTKTNYKMCNTHSYFGEYGRVYNDVIKV